MSKISKTSSVRSTSSTRAVSALERERSNAGATSAVAPIEDIVEISSEAHKQYLHYHLENPRSGENESLSDEDTLPSSGHDEQESQIKRRTIDNLFQKLLAEERQIRSIRNDAIPFIGQDLPDNNSRESRHQKALRGKYIYNPGRQLPPGN